MGSSVFKIDSLLSYVYRFRYYYPLITYLTLDSINTMTKYQRSCCVIMYTHLLQSVYQVCCTVQWGVLWKRSWGVSESSLFTMGLSCNSSSVAMSGLPQVAKPRVLVNHSNTMAEAIQAWMSAGNSYPHESCCRKIIP